MQIVNGYAAQMRLIHSFSKTIQVIYSLDMLNSFIFLFCFSKLSSMMCRNKRAIMYPGKLRHFNHFPAQPSAFSGTMKNTKFVNLTKISTQPLTSNWSLLKLNFSDYQSK